MKGFFRTQPKRTKRLFSVGSRCTVHVPSDFKKSHATLEGALIEVVSKREFLAKTIVQNQIGTAKVVCKILAAPGAAKDVNVIGMEYPIRRSWLTVDKHKCTCNLKDVLMICGCICGGY